VKFSLFRVYIILKNFRRFVTLIGANVKLVEFVEIDADPPFEVGTYLRIFSFDSSVLMRAVYIKTP
jgi:hypothetical protein